MAKVVKGQPTQQLWAQFRFSIIGSLLAAPPGPGELEGKVKQLASQEWVHPINGQKVYFGSSTIERWFYQSRNRDQDPVGILRRKVRSDAGSTASMNQEIKNWLQTSFMTHRSWSVLLHYDHLKLALQKTPTLGSLPSYRSVTRYMKQVGNRKQPRPRSPMSPGFIKAQARLDAREVRSFEVEYVGGLFHLDFHHGSRRIQDSTGELRTPLLLGILDDRSRLCAHLQWYWHEDTESLVHGFSQSLLKRGLPRKLLSDNGSAMTASEFTQGLNRIGILHDTTLAYSPYQNAKIESFWGSVEGRLMAMLQNKKDLTLIELNQYSQAWVEMEYNKREHSEIKDLPLNRFLNDKNVLRPCPNPSELKQLFRHDVGRRQRHSDGTVSIESKRFEVPSQYRHLSDLTVRYARWDLSEVNLIDPRTQNILCRLLPVDLLQNSNQIRKPLSPCNSEQVDWIAASEVSPLLQKYMEDYSAFGLPPAFIPLDPSQIQKESI